MVKRIAEEVARKNGLRLKSITNYGDRQFFMATLAGGGGTEKYLNLAIIGNKPKILHFIMSRNYVLNVAKEERDSFPDTSSIHQDDQFAYVVTDFNTESCLSEFPMEKIYLSPKTHALYETISGYVKEYESVQETLSQYRLPENTPDEEGKKVQEYLRSKGTYEAQIIDPLMKAVVLLMGYANHKCIQKDTPYGRSYSLGFWNEDGTKTMMVLLLEKKYWGDGRETVSIQMVQSMQDGVPVMVPVPDKIPEICRVLKQRERR